MQSKWRAPACYVGVAVICALYLSIVPGVRFTDVCAGAGLGAAVMWAINEWEVGKWNIPLPTLVLTPAPAAALAAAQAQASPLAAAPAPIQAETVASQPTSVAASPAEPAIEVSVVVTEPESRPRVDSGVATQGTLEKWDIDEKEPSWDPSALAETWAKLRAELSINRSGKPAVSPDLPQTARLAHNAPAASRPAAPKTVSKPVAANSYGNKLANGKPASGTTFASPAKGTSNAKPGSFTLGSYGQNNGTSLLAGLTSKTASASAAPVRKVAGAAAEPARQTSLLLRPGTIRPR